MARRNDFVPLYKANSKKTGAAAQLKLNTNRDCLHLEMAKQVGDAKSSEPYDWGHKINMKLGHADIAQLLQLFNGNMPLEGDPKKPDLQLFHKNPKGNKILKLKKQGTSYYLKVSQREDESIDIAIPISGADVELIKIALTKGYEIILGW